MNFDNMYWNKKSWWYLAKLSKVQNHPSRTIITISEKKFVLIHRGDQYEANVKYNRLSLNVVINISHFGSENNDFT